MESMVPFESFHTLPYFEKCCPRSPYHLHVLCHFQDLSKALHQDAAESGDIRLNANSNSENNSGLESDVVDADTVVYYDAALSRSEDPGEHDLDVADDDNLSAYIYKRIFPPRSRNNGTVVNEPNTAATAISQRYIVDIVDHDPTVARKVSTNIDATESSRMVTSESNNIQKEDGNIFSRVKMKNQKSSRNKKGSPAIFEIRGQVVEFSDSVLEKNATIEDLEAKKEIAEIILDIYNEAEDETSVEQRNDRNAKGRWDHIDDENSNNDNQDAKTDWSIFNIFF
jgi:hypothetical protein